MNKLFFLSILTLSAVVVAGCNRQQPAPVQPDTGTSQELEEAIAPSTTDGVAPGTTASTYTLTDVNQHASEDDCWLVIEGSVYDVTEFIASSRHPGGDAILEGCGKDATELFNTRPMGSETPHSEAARNLLPNFKIGDLAE